MKKKFCFEVGGLESKIYNYSLVNYQIAIKTKSGLLELKLDFMTMSVQKLLNITQRLPINSQRTDSRPSNPLGIRRSHWTAQKHTTGRPFTIRLSTLHHIASLKTHERSCGKKPTPYTGCARVALERLRKQQHQETLECVKIGDKPLKNVFGFKYLGSEIQADGDSWQAVKVRMGMAQSVFGKLHEMWNSQDLKMVKKLYLYRAGVVSICTHAFETWHFSDKIRQGCNPTLVLGEK